jgi:hypothetical protein
MGDAPDQNEIGDVDSLASTVESDPEAEYCSVQYAMLKVQARQYSGY